MLKMFFVEVTTATGSGIGIDKLLKNLILLSFFL